jgi:ParB-like chromosome segregation protein Spo0J
MEMRFHLENLARHNVTIDEADEADEALADSKGFTQKVMNGARLRIGKTISGRFLEIAYRKLPDGTLFVFRAMNAKEHQKKRYKQR